MVRPERVLVAQRGGEQCLGREPAPVVRPVGNPGHVTVDLGQAVPVQADGGVVQRLEGAGGDLVETPHQLVVLAGAGLPQHVAQDPGVDQRERRPPAQRRIGARPGVPDGDHPGGHRVAVDDVPPQLILQAGHGIDTGDRLRVGPVRGERVAGDGSRPGRGFAQRPQRLVPGAHRQHDTPGAVVGGQGQDRHRVVRLGEHRTQGGQVTRTRPEVPCVIDEPGLVAFLDRPPGPGRDQPRGQRRSASRAVDDEIGRDHAVRGEHTRHPRGPAVGAHADDAYAATHRHQGGQRGLQHRPAGGHRIEPVIAVARLAAQLGQYVHPGRAGGEQRVRRAGQFGPQLRPAAGQQIMRQPELGDAGPPPVVPRVVGRRRRVAFEHGHVVPVAGQQHRGAQAGQAGPQDHYVRHVRQRAAVWCSLSRSVAAHLVSQSLSVSSATALARCRR